RPSAISGRAPARIISARDGFGSTTRLATGPGGVAWKGSNPGASAVEPPAETAAAPPASGAGLNNGTYPLQPASAARSRIALSGRRPGNRASRSTLQQGRERLVELLDRRCPRHALAIDEKCRCRSHPEAIGGA